jgi:hypothetical protein
MKPYSLLAGAFLAGYFCGASAQAPTPPTSVLPPTVERSRADPVRVPGSAPMLDIQIDREGISLPKGVEDRRPELEPRREELPLEIKPGAVAPEQKR